MYLDACIVTCMISMTYFIMLYLSKDASLHKPLHVNKRQDWQFMHEKKKVHQFKCKHELTSKLQ